MDMHLADQLLIYAAMAQGKTRYSTSRVSDHLRTNASVIGRFLDRKIEIEESGVVSVG
jgi:RNA 3'-terminal phosphate cyclase (ATP)